MQFIVGKRWSREQICSAYGVPVALLTNDATSGLSNANSKYGSDIYAIRGVKPRLELIEQTINRYLMPKYDTNNRVYFVFDNPVGSDKQFELEKIKSGIPPE